MTEAMQPMGTFEKAGRWYKDAIIYQLHVRAFLDSGADGTGDFPGLIEKLDYLKDLGVTAIWLLPFYPSPLRDDGYDIADYTQVHPAYGNLDHFARFLAAAKARGLRVITELVMNHTSADHPWFQRARRAPPGSVEREFYVWSDSSDRYRDARIIFRDFEPSNWSWDPVARAYYWHRFYAHQPDLNFDNPAVKEAMFEVVDFWFGMGVDGLRLDAVPYLFEREGTNCENLPETHAFLRALRAHVDHKFEEKMLLAEANQWPEDAAAYFGAGDECHMNFHFPLMPRMFMALKQESAFPICDILEQTPDAPDSCQWAIFLRNHDELTLEMVTDEDRDYMYRMYAADPQARINLGIRRRLAPLLGERNKLELLNALLFSLPGTPIIYYGDEIGMGDNVYLGDRNGVRTPMQWSADRNAGFSRANPQRLFLPVIIDPEYHYEAVNVEAQQENPSSLLWWMKRLIALRKQHPVFARGKLEFVPTRNKKALAFVRTWQNERALVVANLSRDPQFVELDLKDHVGRIPLELFGHTEYPKVDTSPYFLSLARYGFYWFSLLDGVSMDEQREEQALRRLPRLPMLRANDLSLGRSGALGSLGGPLMELPWSEIFETKNRSVLVATLLDYATRSRWFRGKARRRRGAEICDIIPMMEGASSAVIVLLKVEYVEGEPETYVLPLSFAKAGEDAWLDGHAAQVIAQVEDEASKATGRLYDAMIDPAFCLSLLGKSAKNEIARGTIGFIEAAAHSGLSVLQKGADLTPRLAGVEQTNTSVIFGHELILKLFRLLETGESPDLEISRFLAGRAAFPHTPMLAAALSYVRPDGVSTLGIVQGLVRNHGDAWQMTVDFLERYYERVLCQAPASGGGALGPDSASLPHSPFTDGKRPTWVFDLMEEDLPEAYTDLVGAYLELARLLGSRTAELHVALATDRGDLAFAPEPMTLLYQRSLYQEARARVVQTTELLRQRLSSLPTATLDLARSVLDRSRALDVPLRAILEPRIEADRIRIHGDYHLGQVLFTGDNFVILDFEGEPAVPVSQRRFKRSPLRDVAGMLRSLHYASVFALRSERVRSEDVERLGPWSTVWVMAAQRAFLKRYLEQAEGAPFLPRDRRQLETMLKFYTIHKCIYELAYELNNRPDWVFVPLTGLAQLIDEQEG